MLQGTVLIKSAEELESYSSSEERKLEEIIKGIADAGTRVVAAGAAIGEMAMHFIEKYKMMAVRHARPCSLALVGGAGCD